jgi:transcriptional regulator with XRE-family HTH domain
MGDLTVAVRQMILDRMNDAEISQRTLARSLGVSEPRVSQMLSKAKAPNLTLATIERISDALGILANQGTSHDR